MTSDGPAQFGIRTPHGGFHDWNQKKFYTGTHFYLDVF